MPLIRSLFKHSRPALQSSQFSEFPALTLEIGISCQAPITATIWFSSPMAASALLAHLTLCRLWREMRHTSFPPLPLSIPVKCSRPPEWQFLGRCPQRSGMETNSLASGIDEDFWCCSSLSLSWPDVLCVSHWSTHMCVYLTVKECVCALTWVFPRAPFESDSVDVCFRISGASHALTVTSSLWSRWCCIDLYNRNLIIIAIMEGEVCSPLIVSF